MSYNGFRHSCGCHCAECDTALILEGYADADGAHYCPRHDDYVRPREAQCQGRTPERIESRQRRINAAGAQLD